MIDSHYSKFERLPLDGKQKNDPLSEKLGCMKSIEGYIICVTGLHEETQEMELVDEFSEFGKVRNIHMNTDRQTGYVKGYAFLEYESINEAQDAINNMNKQEFMGK